MSTALHFKEKCSTFGVWPLPKKQSLVWAPYINSDVYEYLKVLRKRHYLSRLSKWFLLNKRLSSKVKPFFSFISTSFIISWALSFVLWPFGLGLTSRLGTFRQKYLICIQIFKTNSILTCAIVKCYLCTDVSIKAIIFLTEQVQGP